MNTPENHACLIAAPFPPRCGLIRMAVIALVGLLPLRLIGGDSEPHITACAEMFLDPIHSALVSVSKDRVVPCPITVSWTTSAGCTFVSGRVSVYLVRVGTLEHQYCASFPLSPQANNTQTVAFSVVGGASVGTHRMKCYVTGKLSDGTDYPPRSHSDYPRTSHCVP